MIYLTGEVAERKELTSEYLDSPLNLVNLFYLDTSVFPK